MRVGLLLLGLLVTVGIMLMLFRTEAPAIQAGEKGQQEAQQISGRDANGVAAMNSYTAEEYSPGGQFRGIKITALTPGGPMDQYYQLKVGDVVLQIKGNDVGVFGDYGAAKGQLDEAYQDNAPLLVQRGSQQISLPPPGTKSPMNTLIPNQ
jgi:S1-C subfamily serine protease